jgi:hypothetical protein
MKTMRSIVVVLFIVLAFGCAKNRIVHIESDPQGALVRASADIKGPQNLVLGKTPLTHKFAFSNKGPTKYELELSYPGYQTLKMSLDQEDETPDLKLFLDREVVREIEKFEIEVSESSYGVVKSMVRSWVQDIEREGTVASSLIKLSENQSCTGLTCSHDGQHLYFSVAEEIEGKESPIANIRAIRTDGGGVMQITSGMWLDSSPTCTSDGKYIFFNSNRLQQNKPDIFRIGTEKNSGISVIRQSSEGASYEPSSYSGDYLVYTFKPAYSRNRDSNEQLWTLGGENHYPTQLRDGKMPAISPDGKEIAFISADKQVWKMPNNAQNPVQLTNDPVFLEGKKTPTWSPDGEYILFASDVGKDDQNIPNYDIWMIHSDGGAPIQLTTNGSEDSFPVVSPDGRYIYFVSNRGYKEGIWRIQFPNMR